ncbi:MAG: hypothetical protein ACLFST_02685 [Spirochaetia bacterium]
MKVFHINKLDGIEIRIEVLREDENGFDIILSSTAGNMTQESHEHIPRYLLEEGIISGMISESGNYSSPAPL